MTWQERFRRSSRVDPPGAEHDEIDQDTGEILSKRVTGAQDSAAASHSEAPAIEGERGIPSVNRERSMQSRISSSLALATVMLLGAGFLVWYYNTQFAKAREAEDAARKAASARVSGEMKVPPLGRVDPPAWPSRVGTEGVSATPPPPLEAPPAPVAANAGAPQKTPEQLALERQLGAPVLRRAQATSSAGAALPLTPMQTSGTPMAAAGIPSMAQMLASLQMPGSAAPSAPGSTLAAQLRPTATPAVSAQLLPARRLLLPKGAFIDCTLETAIDSTYEGMTTCIGASDIYGADGKVVLLERGTKYVGEQRGEPRQGQGRVFVVWNEARTPTGVVVQLGSPGTDELGRNGLPGFVDTHFWQRFGAAILVSVVDGTMQAIAARQQSGTNIGSSGGVSLSPQSGRDVVTEILRSTVSIPPTVIKNQGERIQILVARDVDFGTVYALRNEPARP